MRLQVEFEFEGTAQDVLFGAAFEKVCNELIDAFVRRAAELYGDATELLSIEVAYATPSGNRLSNCSCRQPPVRAQAVLAVRVWQMNTRGWMLRTVRSVFSANSCG